MPTYDTPGVYIEEQTGPGVIAGVGTSTAAFVGPARRGPILEPVRISSYDEFLNLYAAPRPDGSRDPLITSPRWFYMALAVRGFFTNGGRQAYIVRIGTAAAATWAVRNRSGAPGEIVLRVQALEDSAAENTTVVSLEEEHATGNPGVEVAAGEATVDAVDGADARNITVDDASPFRVGDVVTEDGTSRATIQEIDGNDIRLSNAITGLAATDTLRTADLTPTQGTIRLASTAGLSQGSVVLIEGRNPDDTADVDDYALVESVDGAGFVTLAASPARTESFRVVAGTVPTLTSQELNLVVTPAAGSAERFEGLSLEPTHPRYAFTTVNSSRVRLLPPDLPPTAAAFPDRLVAVGGDADVLVAGVDDSPGDLVTSHFQGGLDALRSVDDVNVLSVPDAAWRGDWRDIQLAMLQHCIDMKERFAVLDSRPGLEPAGVEDQREDLQLVGAAGSFAALYYPWLVGRVELRDPATNRVTLLTLPLPPSGHLAGVYARTDNERGVHKAPANTDVRGVLGLERRLTDGQQGPLNLLGVNVLRIFQGSSAVVVWGARTTVDPNVTDWIYVNVRRLMLYIEESIEEGIRWAVFEPNNLALWQKLKRTIGEFLSRVWRDGALFGESADKAYYVRIDEALNPPSVRALGRLYIEIGVAVVRPAEFIIVRIGLWDGGADVTEG